MKIVEQHLKSLCDRLGEDWSHEGAGMLRVHVGANRYHRIQIVKEADDYWFTAVVLLAKNVTRTTRRWNELARLVWQRNAEREVVAFGFDDNDRLVGSVRHPARFLDEEEVEFYIRCLAIECDRLEYLLTGLDVQ
jgi:hypothetical protein